MSPNLTETSKFSRRYTAVHYPEDIDEEPLTSEYVDEDLTHVPTPQNTPDRTLALVPSELATPPDPHTDTSLVPESPPIPERSIPDHADVEAPISECASIHAGPCWSSHSTHRPVYLKDYVT